jgi:protein O-mannosyl-transferase
MSAMTITRGRRKFYLILFGGFLLILLMLDYRAFDAPLYYDSVYLAENEHAFASGNPIEVIKLFPQRPIAMASFYLNYQLSGLTPAHFRMLNALLMAGTALLVVLITITLLEICRGPDARGITEDRLVAIFLGLFFVAHPVQTFVVLYIWQRMALLSAFFYCAAFLAYVTTRLGRFRPLWVGYLICSIMFLFALASKENAITLPAVIILAEIAFFKIDAKTALRRVLFFGALFIVLAGIFSFLERPHGKLVEHSGILATIRQYYLEAEHTLLQVIINQCRMVFHYIQIVFFPTPGSLQLISPQIVHRSILESPAALAGVIGTVALACLGTYLLRRRPLAGFGILFFLINLLPEALLVPQYLFVVYRATLPMVGMLFVAAYGLSFVLRKIRNSEAKIPLGSALATILTFSLILTAWSTVLKVELWQNPRDLWAEVVSRLPEDYTKSEKMGIIHALNSMGVALQRAGNYSEALTYHLRAVEVEPKYRLSYLAMANAYSAMGKSEEAERNYRKVLDIRPNSDTALVGLAQLRMRDDRIGDAKHYLHRALEIAPHNHECQNLMGMVLFNEGNYAEALPYFRKALELKPNYGEAHFHLGKVFSKMGRTREAALEYAKALELEPNNWKAHNDLGIIFAKAGRVENAVLHFREALRINPEDQAIKANLGNALTELRSLSKK